MPYDPMTAAFQQMLSGGLDGHHNHEGLRGGNSNGWFCSYNQSYTDGYQGVDPLQLFESMGLYSPRRPRGMGPSGQDLLELLASGSRPRPRGIDPLSQGLLEILANGGQRHHPVDVIVEHRHSPRRGRRPKNYRSYDRGSAYYPSDDTEYYGSEIDDDYDTRSYVRRRPRHHYSHSHSRRRAWSPSYRDLDGFGFWSRGRPRHRIHFGTARDGSYTDREFTLR